MPIEADLIPNCADQSTVVGSALRTVSSVGHWGYGPQSGPYNRHSSGRLGTGCFRSSSPINHQPFVISHFSLKGRFPDNSQCTGVPFRATDFFIRKTNGRATRAMIPKM
jgi:hypothetical protein